MLCTMRGAPEPKAPVFPRGRGVPPTAPLLPQGRVFVLRVHWARQVLVDISVPSPDPDPDVSGIWLRSDRGHETKNPSQPHDWTRCCSSGLVQLTSVLARVPRVLGEGLLSYWCHHRPLSSKSLDGRAPGSLQVASGAQNPQKTRDPQGRCPLGATTADASPKIAPKKSNFNLNIFFPLTRSARPTEKVSKFPPEKKIPQFPFSFNGLAPLGPLKSTRYPHTQKRNFCKRC